MANPKDQMKPRQRCAIANPIVCDSGAMPHARHHKRNGYVQSILTFGVAEILTLKDPDVTVIGRSIDGWFAIWHARVSMYPVCDLDEWSDYATAQALKVLERLLTGVGVEEDIEVHNGADLKSIHVCKWATHEEIRLAEFKLGMKFDDRKSEIKGRAK